MKLSLDKQQFQQGIVVGVSGGIDSVVLLDALAAAARSIDGATIIVGHVNYQLRGTADGDETFVHERAQHYGFPFEGFRCGAPKDGVNFQAWARDVRYKFLRAVAERNHCAAIAVAQHRDDQAETVVWHLLRGTGLSGLTGMQAERHLSGDIQLLRPLLRVSRAEIATHATYKKLEHRHDVTNDSSQYTRGRIRHELLPLCETIHTGATGHIAATAHRLQQDAECLDAYAKDVWQQLRQRDANGSVLWDRLTLLTYPAAIRVRVLRLAYADVSGISRGLVEDHLQKMEAIASGKGRAYCLPGPCLFKREGAQCRITKGSLRFPAPHGTVPDDGLSEGYPQVMSSPRRRGSSEAK